MKKSKLRKQLVAITVPVRITRKGYSIVRRCLVYDPGPFAPKPKVQSGISGLTKK